jgi:putative membrane protein
MSTGDTNTDLAFMRTYMAAERTHLAWIRTSLSILGFTMVLLKLYDPAKHNLRHHQKLFIFVGVTAFSLLLYSTYRYYYTLYMIDNLKFTPDWIGIAAVSLTMMCLALLAKFLLQPKIKSLPDSHQTVSLDAPLLTESERKLQDQPPMVDRMNTNLAEGIMANMVMDFD